MQLNQEQQEYIQLHPIEVALTMPATWYTADSYLPVDIVAEFLDTWIASRDESIVEAARLKVARDPAYYFKFLKAQELALEYVQTENLQVPGFEVKYQSQSKGLILWSIDQGDDTIDSAMAILNQFDLSMDGCTETFGAQYMWDLQARRQTGDFRLQMHGDDRGYGEGAYCLTIAYNNAEVDRIFNLGGCGLT